MALLSSDFGAGRTLKSISVNVSFYLKKYPELKKRNELAKNGLISSEFIESHPGGLLKALMRITEAGPARENRWQGH